MTHLSVWVLTKLEGEIKAEVPSHKGLHAPRCQKLLQAVAARQGTSQTKHVTKVAAKGATGRGAIGGTPRGGAWGSPTIERA